MKGPLLFVVSLVGAIGIWTAVVAPARGATGAEGTAILEIIHDIAPGAQLRFANFSTGVEFNQAVDFLAGSSDIVIDDIGWFGVGPYDGTSSVSQNTADALNGPGPILGYFTAVGNQARRHYQGEYVGSSTVLTGADVLPSGLPPGDTWTLHEFDAVDGTVEARRCIALLNVWIAVLV